MEGLGESSLLLTCYKRKESETVASVQLEFNYLKAREGLDESGSDKWMHDDLPEECKYCGKEVDNAGKVACNNCIDKRKDTLE